MSKEVTVTGGCGFIGSHLVEELLRNNFRVNVIDNLVNGRLDNLGAVTNQRELRVWKHDILSDDFPPIEKSDYVFHLAGIGDIVPSISSPTNYVKNNVLGTVNVLEFARKLKSSKFIYAASSSCYGLAKTPTSENFKIDPQYPYALTKYLGELAVLHWGTVYGIQTTSIRIFNAYGPRSKTSQNYGAMFGVFLKQKLAGKPLTVVGDGTQSRDFIYVTDVAKAFRLIAESSTGLGIINLGKGKSDKVIDIAKQISTNIEFIPSRPGEPHETLANIDKLIEVTNWKPEIQINEGLKLMLEDINQWQDAPLWDSSSIDKVTSDWFKYLSQNSK